MTTTDQNMSLPLIGILGDGQLAMMMSEAYQSLGGRVLVMGATNDGPASGIADEIFVGSLNSKEDLAGFIQKVDIVTLENEFVDGQVLSALSEQYNTPIFPNPDRFQLIGDKLSEKQFYQSLGIPQAEFLQIKTEEDIPDAIGYMKLAKGGYDGHGTYRVESKEQATELFNKIKSVGVVLFEYAVNFKMELSLIAASNGDDIVFYPMVETLQQEGTCRYVSYPSGISSETEKLAQSQVASVLKKLDTKGLFAFEYFLTQDDELILNESAPRPHNSGHITLDLADCSQFENHMRAVAGLLLIKPSMQAESMTMVNLLGTRNGEFDPQTVYENIDDPDVGITLYRKKESRVKRKMGHINLWGDKQMQRAETLVEQLEV